ncbi:hypothetical protein FGO68_gene12728 [Halteria grandinella]|uniref:Uncharacterized protein n=1 Tax=Halteria grandinella TaxID=5974 RepID=A0A8J8T7S6_HALGN|nr:hypothetical protein FGO68_gene12728 [Halteria grandinella]
MLFSPHCLRKFPKLQLSHYRLVKIKLKISFEAARRQISILELFLDTILLTYKNLYMGKKRRALKRHEEYLTEKMRENNFLTPLSLIDKFLKSQTHKNEANHKTPLITKNLFNLKAVQARVRYQRIKYEKFLKFKVQFNVDMTQYLPLEFKVSKLPLSYQFYDAVPQMMAKYISALSKIMRNSTK